MFHVKHWEALLFYAAAERKRLSLSFLSGLEKPFPLSPFPFRDGGTIFVRFSYISLNFSSGVSPFGEMSRSDRGGYSVKLMALPFRDGGMIFDSVSSLCLPLWGESPA